MDEHIGAPLHCYTCADGGQMLENWDEMRPNDMVVSWLEETRLELVLGKRD